MSRAAVAVAAVALLVAALCSAASARAVHGARTPSGVVHRIDPSADRIAALPGAPAPVANLTQYSGYVTVDASHGRNLFYWFIEAQSGAASAPVVLWLTGGPGCSSLSALLSENGPYWPNSDGTTLQYNAAAWTNAANVIWLESPSGVGFSYSDTKTDYKTGDQQTADDSFNFLVQFFKAFPQFAKNKFFVSGESYGGHYVPELANRVVEGNKAGQSNINIGGFLVGNAWTTAPLDNLGAVQFWLGHAMISNTTYEGIVNNCDFAHVGPLRATNDACDVAVNNAHTEFGRITIYDVYEDICTNSQIENPALRLHRLARLDRETRTARPAAAAKKRGVSVVGDEAPVAPCIDNYVTKYLNQPAVQSALHAQPTQWSICDQINVDYSYADLLSSVVPIYQKLFNEPNFRILVYSGDVDGIVPFRGTENWINALNMSVHTDWHPWYTNNQVAGRAIRFDEMSFATVRGAGHMVPGTQPDRAFTMFSAFVNGQPL